MSKLTIVVGGQYGSEGKGAIAGYLSQPDQQIRGGHGLAAVRVAGPNAGHTCIDAEGVAWKLQQIPVAAVTNPDATLIIAAGSEIDLTILYREIEQLDRAGYRVSDRLKVDRTCTLITDDHSAEEYGGVEGHGSAGLTHSIGSTGKGVGAARAARAMRNAELYGANGIDTADWLHGWIAGDGDVLIEGTQGYGLGQHAGLYPYVTSSDCRAVDFCAMAGVTPWTFDQVDTWVVLRTFPIRVAGNSGPLKDEITWGQLRDETGGYVAEPEQTTVTRKQRRIGRWDPDLARRAVRANGGGRVGVALTFIDYVFPELAGESTPDRLHTFHQEWVAEREAEIGAAILLLGTGPSTVIDLYWGCT